MKFTWTMSDEQWSRWWDVQQGQAPFTVRRIGLLGASLIVLDKAFCYLQLPHTYIAALITWIGGAAVWASVDWKRNEKRFLRLRPLPPCASEENGDNAQKLGALPKK
jgi:hypothetical protein